MRGSPFQFCESKVYQVEFLNKQYDVHKNKLLSIKESSRLDMPNTQLGKVNEFGSRSRSYTQNERCERINKANQKLVEKIKLIESGRELAVGYADPSKNLKVVAHSPVSEWHSMNMTAKYQQKKQIEKDNQALAERLKNVSSTVTFSSIQKNAQEQERRLQMHSRANRPTKSVTKKDPSNRSLSKQAVQELLSERKINSSASEGGLHDDLRGSIDQKALVGEV